MPAVSRTPTHPDAGRRIGGFEVEQPLGEGGMGVVMRARHVVSGAAVAIKLIAPGHADPARSARRFRDEVRAAACLDHPNVVRIHDFGEHDDGSGPPTPYLVMELCTGGTLDVAGCADFGRMRAMLLDVLGALAHAHARDVVHRDLKPSNVLVATPGDGRPGLKLIDFGLARVREGLAGGVEVAGTPRYMAPEQFAGRRSEIGPATDLYALGCIAYELASGRPPFRGSSPAELATAHSSARPPPLHARFPIPSSLASWIARLLQKEPARRFACAADAAHMLATMSDDCDVAPVPTSRLEGDRESTVTQSVTRARTRLSDVSAPTIAALQLQDHDEETSKAAKTVLAPHLETPSAAALDVSTPAEEAPLPPMPSFATALPPAVAAVMGADEGTEDPLGLGLGVYALRGLPFVGRVDERERLWAALAQVRETGRARGVVVRGSSGIGKSRLVEWLAERAAELGAARTLRATHAGSRGPDDGIGPMLARDLRLADPSRPALVAKLAALAAEALDPREIDVVAEIVAPTVDARRTEAGQRHEAVRRLIAGLSVQRPTIVWLDDVGFDLESLELARHVLTQADDRQAILVVVTADLDAIEARPEARRALDRLGAVEGVETIDLAPLPPDDHARLVRRLLRLAPAAASRIATLTAGSPSYAIALIGAWASAGVLVHDVEGFRLRDGADAVLPPSLVVAWSERALRLLAHASHAERVGLELAATCGRVVHAGDWLPACARAGADPRIADRLVDARLARRLGAGDVRDETREGEAPDFDFVFEHGLLVEAIRASAEHEGRWAEHGLTLASVLADRAETPESLERRGRLLLQARDARAFDDLARAAQSAQLRGELPRALELVELARAALQTADVAPSDERWGDVGAIRAAALVRGGAIGAAAAFAGSFVEDARRHGWSRALPEALWAEGTVLGQRGDNTGSRALMEEAIAAFDAIDHTEGTSRALRALVHIERVTGRLAEAEAHLATWLALAGRTQDATSSGWAYQAKAALASARGLFEEAAIWAERAVAEMEAADNLFGVANSLNSCAEIARRRGEHDAASRFYEQALRLSSSMGLTIRHVVRLNLGLLWLQQERWAEAEDQLLRCVRAAPTVGMGVLDFGARAGLLCCAAVARDHAAWREHESALVTRGAGGVDRETIGWVTRAAELARRAGDADLADQAETLAARLGERS